MQENLVTKDDLAAAKKELEQRIETSNAELKADMTMLEQRIEASKTELKADMTMLEQRVETNMANMKVSLIYWMVGTQFATISIVCTVFGVVMGILHT